MVKLDIFSDPVCPWCFLGKARLDAALAAQPDHPFTIEWHPFQIAPDMPQAGIARATYLEAIFGSKDKAVAAHVDLAALFAEAGLEVDFEKLTHSPNSRDSHRLIHWAGIEGRQAAMVSALFSAYWLEGRDIGDAEVLADLADGLDMDAALVRRLLASDADIDEIAARETYAREHGVTSVPTYVIANAHAVPGAQPTALWERVIAELKAQESA
ncbi:DSBA-like thioredoxin domain protein [Aquimixticola soesokkakensis]|uniref:DSBA-like thioredoxin domain protein n=1 Tax=Aquimixticola soesokkakensis TaxID=1519096 RepID=A0A1Y5SM93_9RHOB|nr:DsbA family oxidoreductase [Aquimixticola soesokkakensis]SLN40900.1 DSBA-like thioredoxin domain protein [Aquimixticola soesokkakensis]